jgi:phosphoribosylformylglycinamidine cyclo-ligase
VDTVAGDRAVELMKSAIAVTHGSQVVGGVGGFAGLFDVSSFASFTKPLLATSTDGVGTKVAIAQAIDKHDTIGQDLVGMVVDDIVVVGAKPLFMTDYIACGTVVPERIAEIVAGIARGCAATGTALIGGETAEHPGLLAPNEYDIAGAAVGVVEADAVRGPDRVVAGDIVLALESSGLHANGFSLVRRILGRRGISFTDYSEVFGGVVGEVLLEPTRLYSMPILDVLGNADFGSDVHALSHITGGGISANLSRVLPSGSWVEVDRSTWSPAPIFHTLVELDGGTLENTEGVWNLGVGFIAVVAERSLAAIVGAFVAEGIPAWPIGRVSMSARDLSGFEHGAKGVEGGAVRLVSSYAS